MFFIFCLGFWFGLVRTGGEGGSERGSGAATLPRGQVERSGRFRLPPVGRQETQGELLYSNSPSLDSLPRRPLHRINAATTCDAFMPTFPIEIIP